MAAERDPYLPPSDWKPKSQFFKEIMKRAEEKARHAHVLLTCPECGRRIPIDLSTPPIKD